MPQDVAVYRYARHSSLMLWGTFWAARAMLGQDVLVAAALASFARESHELIHDISHHRRTSAGRAHRCSMSSQCLGQMGRECVLIVLLLSCGHTDHSLCLCLCCSSRVVGPTGTYPGNCNITPFLRWVCHHTLCRGIPELGGGQTGCWCNREGMELRLHPCMIAECLPGIASFV
jgi:hypothetical protein